MKVTQSCEFVQYTVGLSHRAARDDNQHMHLIQHNLWHILKLLPSSGSVGQCSRYNALHLDEICSDHVRCLCSYCIHTANSSEHVSEIRVTIA